MPRDIVNPIVPPVTAETAAMMAALHERCFAGVHGADWSAEAIRAVLNMPSSRGWLSQRSQAPKGFVLVRAAGDDCEILTLGVAPEFRRRGVGVTLMHAAALWARKAELNRLVLEVAVSNGRALKLYERCGFTEAGLRKDYYRSGEGRVDARLLVAHPDTVSERSRTGFR